MEFVTIGNANNVADTTGSPNPAGSVAYIYNLGKYEVSSNMIYKANSAGSLGITFTDYGPNKPATAISWYEAAKFVNWLNTSTGGAVAYKFNSSGTFELWSSADLGYNAANPFRNSLAKYVIPSRDEWYKGAYGSPDGVWYNYPTGSDTAPAAVTGGTDPNTAVFGDTKLPVPADITNAGGFSPWGTMAQGGNVNEWIETAYDGINNTVDEAREKRGGVWYGEGYLLGSTSSIIYGALAENPGVGFRIASVPEPSSISLLVLGGVVVVLGGRRR